MKERRENHLNTEREIKSALAGFLLSLHKEAESYVYVSLTERRLYNFFYFLSTAVLPGLAEGTHVLSRKLLSNSGLLLKHKALAEVYRENGLFPTILVIDDLLVHGRGVGRFLSRLERAILEDLRPETGASLSDVEKDALHYQLVQAVDIRVFARSRNPILLSDGYAAKVHYEYKLFNNQIRRITNVLSSLVSSNKVANTSFVVSAWYTTPHGESNSKALEELPQMKSDISDWKYVPWGSRWPGQNKQMYSYIRLFSDNSGVYLISTVRFYKNSQDQTQTSLVTSYPIFGGLMTRGDGDSLEKLYEKLNSTLSVADKSLLPLCSIFEDQNNYVQQVQAQLASTLLSLADLLEFSEAYGLSFQENVQKTDLDKIVINYGEDTRPGFLYLLKHPQLILDLAETLRSGLRKWALRLPFDRAMSINSLDAPGRNRLLSLFGREDIVPAPPIVWNDVKKGILSQIDGISEDAQHRIFDQVMTVISSRTEKRENWEPVSSCALSADFDGIRSECLDSCKVIDFTNEQLGRAIYSVGMASEAQAYHYVDVPFLYKPEYYDYGSNAQASGSPFGNPVGVIPFQDYMKLCEDLPVSGYGRVAAYLVMLDQGCIASKLQYVPREYSLYTLGTVGERAMFYLPVKLSLFLPALSTVERGTSRVGPPLRETISTFVKEHLTYFGSCISIQVALLDLKNFIEEYLTVLNSSGQMFAGWDIEELTKQEIPDYREAQKSFQSQAQTFLSENS